MDFVNAPNDYWQGKKGRENAIAATKWLIEEKLKFDIPTSKQKLSKRHFKNNDLSGLYASYPLNKLIEMVEYDHLAN